MKRTISAVLCLILVMTMLPAAAFADAVLGGITIATGGQSGTDYALSGKCLTIQSSVPLTVSGSEAGFRIVVAPGATANLTLNGATIDMSNSTFAAIVLENGATLNLTVSGDNTLKGGEKCAGVSAPEGTTLSIGGSGTLNAFGGMYGAGIGGGTVTIANADPEYKFYGADAGRIDISSGTVNATGGKWAAGIGGGAGFERESGNVAGGSGGIITISGGTVNASAGAGGVHSTAGEFGGGAGIGGGGAEADKRGGAGGSITILGGVVNADSLDAGDFSGAAIGGGYRGNAGSIAIFGGTVVAEAGLGGPGIGSGCWCDEGGVIRISDGSVTAFGGNCAAGIGAGWADSVGIASEIIISGGRVNATGGDGIAAHPTRGAMGGGAGIGGGYGSKGSNVTISGGIVKATGGSVAGIPDSLTAPSAIGAGSNNSGTHSFSTGQSGSAVINANTPATPFSGYITDLSNKANWLGTILEGAEGCVYGNQTVNDDFAIDADQTLTIPSTASFTIAEGVTVTNHHHIVNNGRARNSGTITGPGSVSCNNHNWDAATLVIPQTCAFCKITRGEHLPRVRYGMMEGMGELYQDDRIYFGKYTENGTDYDVPWVVLSADAAANSAFLLSEYLLGNLQFQASGSGYYKDSTLNARMDELYNAGANTLFTSNERGAIAAKTNLSCADGQYDDENSPAVPTAYLYPLSYNEAAARRWGSSILKAKHRNAPTGNADTWWLRSSNNIDDALFVMETGLNYALNVSNTYGVRPAMNLDTSKVLFTSSAVGGKAGSGTLGAVSTGTTEEWKLTLLDNGVGSGRESFAITTTALSAASATVDYAGAKTGANEYLSAVIVDNGNVVCYGRILQLDGTTNGASGTAAIGIPSGVTLGADTQLKVFNEQCNGDKATDYASELKLVIPPQTVATPAFSPAGGTYAGTQSVSLSCDTAGATIRYTINGSEPTQDSAVFTGSITVSETTTIKAKAFQAGMVASSVASATYTIHATPADPDNGRFGDPAANGTVYNAERTIWLTGSGLLNHDQLIVERNPGGSAYDALYKLADGAELFIAYNIYLRSGKKSAGSEMYLHFDLAFKYAGKDFTLVHQKSDGSYEYFYNTADANGDLAFGPLYETSPFLLMKGTLRQAPDMSAVDIPQTGDGATPVLWVGIALIALWGFAAIACAIKRKLA